MTAKDLVNNFVSQFNRPFDLNLISTMIDRDPEEVKEVLDELLTTDKIRVADPQQGIYVRNNRYSAKVSYNQKGNWTYDQMEASALMDVMESGSFSSIRDLAKAVGKSRQWVFIYLEALASIGCVTFVNRAYSVTERELVKDVGKVISPGILSKLREADTWEERLKMAAEKERRSKLFEAKKLEREKQRQKEEQDRAWMEARINAWNAYWETGKPSYFDLFEKLGQEKPN